MMNKEDEKNSTCQCEKAGKVRQTGGKSEIKAEKGLKK